MDALVRPLTIAAPIPWTSLWIEATAIVCSAAMFLYVRYGPGDGPKSDAGLFYFVVNAFGVAALNSWAVPATDATLRLSWNTIVILVSSMIMPTTPRRMLVASIVAASMDPLMLGVGHLRGLPTISAVD